ncbi:MAG: hypothetical protein AAGD38_21790 [Acidobacteriota bacterium]
MSKLIMHTLLGILVLALLGCGGDASTAEATGIEANGAAEQPEMAPEPSTPAARGDDTSYFVIEGDEQADTVPRVSVHLDPGEGEGMFNDGITRYEIRMLPKPLGKEDLTVWILNLREDTEPGRVEVTDKLATPSIVVGVGQGLVKGYMKVLSGHIELEELGESITLTFEAELKSQSALDRKRQGQEVTVRGRVVAAKIPSSS